MAVLHAKNGFSMVQKHLKRLSKLMNAVQKLTGLLASKDPGIEVHNLI